MDLVKRVRALTGATDEQAPVADIVELLEDRGATVDERGEGTAARCVLLWVAADLADQLATGAIARVHVTSVEDISIDRGRTLTAWQTLADRLRERARACEADMSDDGPMVVEFHPYGPCGEEAVERVRP